MTRSWHYLFIALGVAVVIMACMTRGLQVSAAPSAPLGRHCGDVGPLPGEEQDYCGCTWGEVYFQDQPISGAAITLTYEAGVVTGTTEMTPLEVAPYFDLTAQDLGARRGDVLTITASFAGREVSRSFRAWPDATGEQHLVLAIESLGTWEPWLTGAYTEALVTVDNTVWAGGRVGLISVNLVDGRQTQHTLPLTSQNIRDLAVGADDHIWALTSEGVAEFDHTSWKEHTPPAAGALHALAVDLSDGTVYVGSGDASGSLAAFTGTWSTIGTFPDAVAAVAVDGVGDVWVGTWGSGAFRRKADGTWAQYTVAEGLASEWVRSLATSGTSVWFGTSPYLSGSGARGGLSRYDLVTDVWQSYGVDDGLPEDGALPQAPASIFALTVDEKGWIWAGVSDGLRYLPDGEQWMAYTSTHGLRSGAVRAIASYGEGVWAGVSEGVDLWTRTTRTAMPPEAQITAISPLTLTPGAVLTLQGAGSATSSWPIVGWAWSSDIDGPVCSEPTCTLPDSLFSPGQHTLTLQVLNSAGLWSPPVQASLRVMQKWAVYLPLTLAR